MNRTRVPKAAVYKDRYAASNKNQVGLAGKPVAQTISSARAPERLAESQLGASIPAPDAGHAVPALGRCENVAHGASLAPKLSLYD